MAPNAWEFYYNGLTFGGSNPHGIITVAGLSPPNARIDEVEKAADHGSWLYAQYLTARTVTIEGDVAGTDATDFESKITALRQAFAPQSDPLPLSFNLPGGVVKRLNCVPTKVDFPIDLNYSMLYDTWAVELMAGDPRLYSDAIYNIDLQAAIPNGIGFNVAFNVNFGGTSGGALTRPAINQGTFPTLPLVTIYGPVTNPTLRNITAGLSLSVLTSLLTTDTLVIDFTARTIYLNGVSSRYSSLLQGSKWWALQPGVNTVQFSGTDVTGSSKATITYRDAWN